MAGHGNVQVILNVTHSCNLACNYCYYSEEMANKPGYMKFTLLKKICEQIAKSTADTIDFSIHGGEPLLMDWDYFKKLFKLQKEYLGDRTINNSIQTNGTLIDENFIENYTNMLSEGVAIGMGISLDGPQEVHDKYRVYKNNRKGSFLDIMENIKRLEKYDMNVAILAVAPLTSPENSNTLYGFFNSIKNLHFLDLLVPRYDTFQNYKKENLGIIYTKMFDDWFLDKEAHFEIRFFYSVVLSWLTGKGSICAFEHDCITNKKMISISTDGDVSFCDSFPTVKIGNIWYDSFDSLVDQNNKVRRKISIKEEERCERCLFCKWYKICHGGCPTNYVPGSNKSNYFCNEYQKIFEHIENRLNEIGLSSQKGLSDDNLEKIINPRLKDFLYKRRTPQKKPTTDRAGNE